MAKFSKGKSGNPAGRRPGVPDKRSELRRALAEHAPALLQKAVELALSGDSAALKLCIDRLIPPARARDEAVSLPDLNGASTLTDQAQAVMKALAAGDLSPGEANTIMAAIASAAKAKEVDELEKRIQALEALTNVST